MRRLDRNQAISFVDVESGAGGCPVNSSEFLLRFHAMENGRLVSGAEAFAAMWRAIPMLRPLGVFARNRILLAILERAYLRFLTIRPRLSAWLRLREVRRAPAT